MQFAALATFGAGADVLCHCSCMQLFVLDGTKATAHYGYLQDLANLNMPAGKTQMALRLCMWFR
jgi:hypothetical protein